MNTKSIKDGLIFYNQNQEELDRIFEEVFSSEEYAFSASTLAPRILDCGAHIGVSVAYFKSKYPQAHITAFEPNPTTYSFLQKNCQANNWQDVEVIHAAVSNSNEKAQLFISRDSQNPWSWGDSLVKNDWYSPNTTTSVEVPAVPLIDYLDTSIELLKLDVEGMEGQILKSIEARLNNIKQMYIEYHGSTQNPTNRLENILKILSDHNFSYTLKENGETKPLGMISTESPRWIIIHAEQKSDIKA